MGLTGFKPQPDVRLDPAGYNLDEVSKKIRHGPAAVKSCVASLRLQDKAAEQARKVHKIVVLTGSCNTL